MCYLISDMQSTGLLAKAPLAEIVSPTSENIEQPSFVVTWNWADC